MVECAGLEIRYTFRRIVSSNLTLSAKNFKHLQQDKATNFGGFYFVAVGENLTDLESARNHAGALPHFSGDQGIRQTRLITPFQPHWAKTRMR